MREEGGRGYTGENGRRYREIMRREVIEMEGMREEKEEKKKEGKDE